MTRKSKRPRKWRPCHWQTNYAKRVWNLFFHRQNKIYTFFTGHIQSQESKLEEQIEKLSVHLDQLKLELACIQARKKEQREAFEVWFFPIFLNCLKIMNYRHNFGNSNAKMRMRKMQRSQRTETNSWSRRRTRNRRTMQMVEMTMGQKGKMAERRKRRMKNKEELWDWVSFIWISFFRKSEPFFFFSCSDYPSFHLNLFCPNLLDFVYHYPIIPFSFYLNLYSSRPYQFYQHNWRCFSDCHKTIQ